MLFIKDTSIQEMQNIAYNIKLVNKTSKATPEQIEECKQYSNSNVDDGELSNWYVLLREAQGDLTPYKNGLKYMIDNHTFLAESLFCEWAYIINLDESIFEIYRGFNQDKNEQGRYASLSDSTPESSSGKYYGVKLIQSIPIKTIQSKTNTEIILFCDQIETDFSNY